MPVGSAQGFLSAFSAPSTDTPPRPHPVPTETAVGGGWGRRSSPDSWTCPEAQALFRGGRRPAGPSAPPCLTRAFPPGNPVARTGAGAGLTHRLTSVPRGAGFHGQPTSEQRGQAKSLLPTLGSRAASSEALTGGLAGAREGPRGLGPLHPKGPAEHPLESAIRKALNMQIGPRTCFRAETCLAIQSQEGWRQLPYSPPRSQHRSPKTGNKKRPCCPLPTTRPTSANRQKSEGKPLTDGLARDA